MLRVEIDEPCPHGEVTDVHADEEVKVAEEGRQMVRGTQGAQETSLVGLAQEFLWMIQSMIARFHEGTSKETVPHANFT